MNDDERIKQAIGEARERVFATGFEDASMRDLTIVLAGYTAERIEAARTLTLKVSGPQAIAAGALVVGVIAGVLRLYGV